jgi:TolB-like protein
MRPMRFAFALLLVSSVARAATPTVAVMPFKDLTGGRGSIGEAIRETVTTDLKDVPGLRVIERANIDRILAEQNLQAMKSDLDALSTVKVGKLLGATLIVAGAYQKAAASVRLTARFVDVETGEIKGTAKVDGAASEFLSLQDRVTVELLRSAGIAAPQVQKFAQRARPKVKSLKTVELYGDAVVETDDHKKQEFLKLALDEDPTFVYASRDLDELEKRLKKYDAASTAAQDKQVRELRERFFRERDPDKRALMAMQVYSGLLTSRRYRTLATECRSVLAGPPPPRPTQPGAVPLDELCAYYLVLSESQLKQGDRVLSDGEAFLRKHTSSIYFKSVEGLMQTVIGQRRKQEEGKSKVAGELAQLDTRQKWDLCRVARVYKFNGQAVEAQRLFRACLEVGLHPRGETLRDLVFEDIELGDWKAARAHADELAHTDDKIFATIRQAIELQIPADLP